MYWLYSTNTLIERATVYCKTTAQAAATVTFFTILVSLFNWGLGLIFGAIFARKTGRLAVKNKLALHYPLIGAAGYSGSWFGMEVFQDLHLSRLLKKGILWRLRWELSLKRHHFSSMNISVSLALSFRQQPCTGWEKEAQPVVLCHHLHKLQIR